LGFLFLNPDQQISPTNQSCRVYRLEQGFLHVFLSGKIATSPLTGNLIDVDDGNWQHNRPKTQHSTMVAGTNRARKLPVARAFPSPNRLLPLKSSEIDLAFDGHWHGVERHAARNDSKKLPWARSQAIEESQPGATIISNALMSNSSITILRHV